MKRILVLTSRFPYPPIGGEKLRIFNLIQQLSRAFEVELCSLYRDEGEVAGMGDMERFCSRVHLVRLPRARRVLNACLGLWKRLPLQVSYYFDRKADERIARILSEGNYDVVLVHLIRMLEYARAFPPGKTVVELTDAISMNYDRIAWPRNPREAIYLLERKRVLRYELSVPTRSRAAILVSETDGEYLKARGYPGEKLLIVKNGTRFLNQGPSEYDPHLIVFLGNMRSAQNEDMCIHFIREILPLIREKDPEARIEVVGANPSRRLRSFHDGHSVSILGEVSDVAARVRKACLSVCPMRYGAGIQNKILESMALGVPVVTTTIGWEGIGARDGEDILIADDIASFAAAAVRLMREPVSRKALSRSGMDFVGREFRWEKRAVPLIGLMMDVAGGNPGGNGRKQIQTPGEVPVP